jgi:hypothetical protein
LRPPASGAQGKCLVLLTVNDYLTPAVKYSLKYSKILVEMRRIKKVCVFGEQSAKHDTEAGPVKRCPLKRRKRKKKHLFKSETVNVYRTVVIARSCLLIIRKTKTEHDRLWYNNALASSKYANIGEQPSCDVIPDWRKFPHVMPYFPVNTIS